MTLRSFTHFRYSFINSLNKYSLSTYVVQVPELYQSLLPLHSVFPTQPWRGSEAQRGSVVLLNHLYSPYPDLDSNMKNKSVEGMRRILSIRLFVWPYDQIYLQLFSWVIANALLCKLTFLILKVFFFTKFYIKFHVNIFCSFHPIAFQDFRDKKRLCRREMEVNQLIKVRKPYFWRVSFDFLF